jgi:nephrocystin-3
MPEATAAAPESREIRVFLSSTFRDFNEERRLLATQVFPELNRRARERGVELVEVDLRWGVTQEQVEGGHALEICLREIERCTPYFIGMLGDSYGSLTPPQRLLLQTEPGLLDKRQWLDGRIGESSYTELEITHGLELLRDGAMEGRAFFYFRDPAWSDTKATAEGPSGWSSETPEERQKLEQLRDRIRSSGHPLVDGLADPQAIAERIKEDLWALIDRQFPEGEQPDALEKEERKHADYRRARTAAGQYVGGEGYITQLEAWIGEGEQQILISGESGAGKSTLLANWMQRHQQQHPEDVLYAHHLGCTNDASALRPLLGRLIDTASKQLLEAERISEPLKVPDDWWDLVATVAETLQTLGRWATEGKRRWIWVLDGLDRLAEDDQNALPWLPATLPEGIHVVASALACPAREILSQQGYTTLTIQPLRPEEQEQLIQRYLSRYTKELDGGLRQQILQHELAGSPLFLKVLLEELRQCGRFDTLQEQLRFYLSASTVDDLYERVLERLENDGNGEAVRQVMTALWASRAGLAETELRAITGLSPLQWAPIDLALEKAFGRNGNRLVFDHDYLRKAVEDRFLPSEEARRQAHSALADWYQSRDGWDERDSEELPWQLQQAGLLDDLREWLQMPSILASLVSDRGSREVVNYWLAVKSEADGELDELIAEAVEEEIEKRKEDASDLIWFVDRMAMLLEEAGLYRELLLRLRTLSLELEEATEDRDEESMLTSLAWLASAQKDQGNYDEAEALYHRCLEAQERLLGREHPSSMITVNNLGLLYVAQGDYVKAETFYQRCLEAQERLLGREHPSTLTTVGNLGLLYQAQGDYEKSEAFYQRDLEGCERLLGREHPTTLTTIGNMGLLYQDQGDYEKAEAFYQRGLEGCERLLGREHPDTLITVNNMAGLYQLQGDNEKAEALYQRCLEAQERLLGREHPTTLTTVNNLAGLYQDQGDYEKAEAFYQRCLEARERLLGREHPSTLTTIGNLGLLYQDQGDYEKAEAFYQRDLEGCERLLGREHPSTLTTVGNLASLYKDLGDYEKAEAFYQRCLEARERLLGREHPSTLTTVGNLAALYQAQADYERAEVFYQRCLEASERLLGPEHPDTNGCRFMLANLYSDKERYSESIPLRRRELEVAVLRDGRDAPGTLISIHRLAEDLYWSDQLEESEQLYREALAGRIKALGDEEGATMASRYGLARCLSAQERYDEAIEIRRVELTWCQADNGVDPADMLVSMHGLGCDLGRAEQPEEALEVLQQCLNQRRNVLGVVHEDTLGTHARVLDALCDLGRQQEAIAQSRDIYKQLLNEFGANHPETLVQLENQAIFHEQLDDLDQAAQLWRQCLSGREMALGAYHPDALSTGYRLADVLSAQERHAEAIPLRRRELAWCQEQNGDTDPGTLQSINQLAIDLREVGELEEAEDLFRQLLIARQKELESADYGIGRALGGLAKTLEDAQKLDEALVYAQQAFNHRLQYEGSDNWFANYDRLDLARVLYKLKHNPEALDHLDQLQASLTSKEQPDADDTELLQKAEELRGEIITQMGESPA